tara:strand:- start:255 stop:485 length:231 start_codon:yes stop_codon:yes gene_type:complete
MDNNEVIILKLRATINTRLDMCDGRTMPYVCEMAKSKEGREIILGFVVDLVAQGGFTIIDALMEKERSLNPNLCQD